MSWFRVYHDFCSFTFQGKLSEVCILEIVLYIYTYITYNEGKFQLQATVGVPANYGGFESLVENIIGYNSLDDIHYTVYCSAKGYPHRQSVYKNADLKYVPLDANGSQVSYTISSL